MLAKQPQFCSFQVKWNYSQRQNLAGQARAARSWTLGQLSCRSTCGTLKKNKEKKQQSESARETPDAGRLCGFPIARRFPYGRGSRTVPACSVLWAGLDQTHRIPTSVALEDVTLAMQLLPPDRRERAHNNHETHMHVYMCTCSPQRKGRPTRLSAESDLNRKRSSVMTRVPK